MEIQQERQARPIGQVVAENGEFGLVIEEKFRKGLKGLKDWSHVTVIWWGHLVDDEDLRRNFLVAEKPYQRGPDQLGIFSTRSPVRPNPLEITHAALLSVDEESGFLALPWIDAEHGSPVMDIKPYVPAVDRVRDASCPAWAEDWPAWVEDSATFDWGAVFANAR